LLHLPSSQMALLLLTGASAFAPSTSLLSARGVVQQRSAAPLCQQLSDPDVSRRAVLFGSLGVALGLGARPVQAGYVTSLGIETTLPKDAEKDDELLKSSAVQKSIEGIKGYKSAAQALKSKFASDTAMPLIPAIRKDFDFSKVWRFP
jgi:hypothetical protein